MDAHDAVACAVEVVSPEEVDAGTGMGLMVRVSCAPPSDLRGLKLAILDHTEAVVADGIEVVEFDGATGETGTFTIKAPSAPGDYTWSAVVSRQELGGVVHAEAKASFSFTTEPHATRMAVWDVPSAIPVSGAFRAKVGIKCSAGCDQTGREFGIYDHNGKKVASGVLSEEIWPGTTALHFAEVAFEAPTTLGTLTWEARTSDWNNELPHEGGVLTFGINIVQAPDHVVTVEAVDQDKQTPIKGIHVILHPFRAFTDDHGVARLSVPQGKYELHVAGLRYFPYETELEVTEDVSIRAELKWEVRPEKIR